ncbi:MAG: hypothetical protein QW291_01055 [Thermofilaceae archaeon]
MLKVKLIRLALRVVEVTSPLLLFLSILYTITGYQMLYPEATLIQAARRLHVDMALRIFTIIVGYLHGLAGLVILYERRIRNKPLKKILEIVTVLGLTILVVFLFALDVYYGEACRRWRWGR